MDAIEELLEDGEGRRSDDFRERNGRDLEAGKSDKMVLADEGALPGTQL